MAGTGVIANLRAANIAWRQPRGSQDPSVEEVAQGPGIIPEPAPEATVAQLSETASVDSEGSVETASGDVEGGDMKPRGRRMPSPSIYTMRFKIFQLVMLGLLVAYVFFLPIWSWLLNDVLGEVARLCGTPASQILCSNRGNYTDIALQFGRRNQRGELVGCGCGEGVLADWSCAPVEGERFSISYFISTAPGTGAMAAFSAWPIMTQWIHGVGNSKFFGEACSPSLAADSLAYSVMWYSQLVFHCFFGLFLMSTLCIQPIAHTVVVVLFIIALVVYFVLLAIVLGVGSKVGKFVLILTIVAVAALITGFSIRGGPSWFEQHAFWLGECIGLSLAFAITPVLAWFY
mmetsp:Transcript_30297/g.87364  ORF Transcript_30297/g.87364 Transcript_30297/m.87364 type:complete len:346 (-) Transcript_30297:341-1378(-)